MSALHALCLIVDRQGDARYYFLKRVGFNYALPYSETLDGYAPNLDNIRCAIPIQSVLRGRLHKYYVDTTLELRLPRTEGYSNANRQKIYEMRIHNDSWASLLNL